MQNPIRILQITDCINYGGGVAAVILNYYNHMDADKVIFDFMVNEPIEAELQHKLEEKGSRVFVMPALSIKNTFNYKCALEAFFKEHAADYQIIHGHTPNAAAYYMPVAKKYGIPVRIIHSHNSRGADSQLKRIRNRLMSRVGIANATHRFACSKVAAEYLYGNDDAFILNNAIDLDAFKFNPSVRNEIRSIFQISDDTKLIGHIGRFAEQKNHKFILDIADAIKKSKTDQQPKIKFILIGDGPLRAEIENQIEARGLQDMFILTGVVSNSKDYYQAMDAFILPSLYEGLPVVGVEAQAAGLPTLVSDKVTPETLMTDNIKQMPIDDASRWAEWVLNVNGQRVDNKDQLVAQGYDIMAEAVKLAEKYQQLATGRGL